MRLNSEEVGRTHWLNVMLPGSERWGKQHRVVNPKVFRRAAGVCGMGVRHPKCPEWVPGQYLSQMFGVME